MAMNEEALVSDSKITNDDGTNPGRGKKNGTTDSDREAYIFVEEKKKEMKKSQYRERWDMLAAEIELNIINTTVSYGGKVYEKTGWGSMVFYNKMANGNYDINVYPQKIADRDQNRSGVPVSQEPIALSKILIATSVLAGKMPDARVMCDDKVYGKAAYELWKRTWLLKGANGQTTLERTYQNLLTYGWAAFRTYPRRVSTKRKGVDKILFDDIYREPMDPTRTWLGVGQNVGDYWSAFEVYYEKDIPNDEFFRMVPKAKEIRNKKNILEMCSSSQEAKDENQQKASLSYTIGYYENVLANRYVVKCGKYIIYDGELPNEENYGSILVARCFVKNVRDPYGVGLYEMMRGNTAMFSYINSLNAQQVEAEIFPLLFGPQVQNGTNTYKRSPNVINPKNPGSTIDVIRTSGNIAAGVSFAQQQKTDIEENTGVNNILAGDNAESTLGSTVILKEAAYNRLTPPKNSMMNALQTDAHIAMSWIEQTYTVDKVFMIDKEEDLATFTQMNPDYFVESQPITNDLGEVTGYAVAASRNLRLNFDFTPEGELLEDVPTRTISAKQLFDDMAQYGHKKSYLEFLIDPDSMLLPSMEIQKQNFMAMYPVIQNSINTIYSLRVSDPEAAVSQLKAFEQFLKIQKENIYDYIPKMQYDAIIAMEPPFAPPPVPEKKAPEETLNYKDAPPDIQRQIEERAGLQPSGMAGMPPSTPGTVPPFKNPAPQFNPYPEQMNQPGMSSDPNLARPKAMNQIERPQSPMGSAVDASMGRAANLPITR